jgi:hypothetical protein
LTSSLWGGDEAEAAPLSVEDMMVISELDDVNEDEVYEQADSAGPVGNASLLRVTGFVTRPVDCIKAHGSNRPLVIYEVICRSKNAKQVDLMRSKLHTQAWNCYCKRNFLSAVALLEQVAALPQPPWRKQDVAASVLRDRCERFIAERIEPPVGWTGIDVASRIGTIGGI